MTTCTKCVNCKNPTDRGSYVKQPKMCLVCENIYEELIRKLSKKYDITEKQMKDICSNEDVKHIINNQGV